MPASSGLHSDTSVATGPSRAPSGLDACDLPQFPSLPPLEASRRTDSVFGDFPGAETILHAPSWNVPTAPEGFLEPDLDLMHP